MSPKRIQLRRTKGWRKPEGAVIVARPSRWGNPWRPYRAVRGDGSRGWFATGQGVPVAGRIWWGRNARATALGDCVLLFERAVTSPNPPECVRRVVEAIDELRGKDLACWCPLDQPCHADVLLEIANADPDR